ncbi:MAG: helix-turn-helix transcriptional regulator [Mycobacterium sp.]
MVAHHVPDAVERLEINTSDRTAMADFLTSAYGTTVRVDKSDDNTAPRMHYRHARTSTRRFAMERIVQRGALRTRMTGMTSTTIHLPRAGRLECSARGHNIVAETDSVTLVQGDNGWSSTRLTDASLTSMTLDPTLLTEAAMADPGAIVHFIGHHPVSSVTARMFTDTARFLNTVVLAEAATATPLIIGAAGRLLASAVLAAFPNTATSEVTVPRTTGGVRPASLDAAIDFIRDNAHRDIGVSDIAAAVYLTPRAVQYMFRRHLATTPIGYLKQVRLARAHNELLAAARNSVTVAATAAKWGFAHTGRFAAAYRLTFGESPHETLRR